MDPILGVTAIPDPTSWLPTTWPWGRSFSDELLVIVFWDLAKRAVDALEEVKVQEARYSIDDHANRD